MAWFEIGAVSCDYGGMQVAFIGSGALGCPALERLLAHPRHRLAGVVTQPDRPRGRSLRVQACPSRALADARGIPTLAPERIADPDTVAAIAAWKPDIIVTAAYGQFLRRNLLGLPPHGAINIHPSLLPRYRGAAPIQWTLARGESVTGVTILRMTERMDAGAMLAQREHPIRPDDTAATLEPRLAELGAELLLAVLDELEAGRATETPQDEAAVTFAPKIAKRDGWIDWRLPADEIHNRIRGFTPWPGGYTLLPAPWNLRLTLLQTEVATGAGASGEVLEAGPGGLLVAAGSGAVRAHTVHPEGRRPMEAESFCRGCRALAGARLLPPPPPEA
jgi:methionyl-tRNA formyltransferase